MQQISLFAGSHRQSLLLCACQHSIEARAGLESSIYLSAAALTCGVGSVAFVVGVWLRRLSAAFESFSAPV
jgi:hypothetical protein